MNGDSESNEEFYKVGDKFKWENKNWPSKDYKPVVYVIARVDAERVLILNTETWNRWSNSVLTESNTRITEEELTEIMGGARNEFTKIEG
jgi:hypothetical protein